MSSCVTCEYGLLQVGLFVRNFIITSLFYRVTMYKFFQFDDSVGLAS